MGDNGRFIYISNLASGGSLKQNLKYIMESKPWFKFYPESVPHQVDVQAYASIVDLFEESVQKFQQATAYECMGKRFPIRRSEEHTSELQSRPHLVCRLLLEKKNDR